MNAILDALVPGLLVALTPALLTVAWQQVLAHREHQRQRSERLTNVFLDLRSEAEALTYQGVFADIHLRAVGKATNRPAIALGHLQAFDLTSMSRDLAAHMARINRLANELIATTEKEATHLAIKRAVDVTNALAKCYMAPDDRRPPWRRLLSSRPPLDEAVAEGRATALNQAFRELAGALDTTSQSRWGRRTWP